MRDGEANPLSDVSANAAVSYGKDGVIAELNKFVSHYDRKN